MNLSNLDTLIKSHIIGIDHGFAQMKSRNACITTGIQESKYESFSDENILVFDGKHYICGGNRQALQDDKTENNNYYLLTLAMVAKEIEKRKLPRKTNITLVAGLPLKTYGRQKESFQKYLEQNKWHRYYDLEF